VSVTLAPRVKVKVSALSLTASDHAGLALTVNANRSWAIASPDGVLAAGTASSAIDTKLLFSDASTRRPAKVKQPIVLTISAP
jgi:autotransporter translocation and assembly factor TamB